MNVLTFDHVSCRYPGQGTDIVDRLYIHRRISQDICQKPSS